MNNSSPCGDGMRWRGVQLKDKGNVFSLSGQDSSAMQNAWCSGWWIGCFFRILSVRIMQSISGVCYYLFYSCKIGCFLIVSISGCMNNDTIRLSVGRNKIWSTFPKRAWQNFCCWLNQISVAKITDSGNIQWLGSREKLLWFGVQETKVSPVKYRCFP